MRNSAIAASGLRKAYGDKVVLDGIDLEVPVGSARHLRLIASARRIRPGKFGTGPSEGRPPGRR